MARFAVSLIFATALALGIVWPASALAAGLPSDWQRGMNVTSWWHDSYEQPRAEAEIARVRSLGTTHVSFLSTWYMDNANSSAISPDALKTPSDTGLLNVMASAKAHGMSVTLKPHVDVRDGSFRGAIAPADPAAWFADYRSMINHSADLARQGGADMLIIGTELTSMTSYTDEWRRIIQEVRSRFGGRLTFAANWTDGASAISFWPELDYIGIDAYMPLSWSDPNPPVEALASAWCDAKDPSGKARSYFLEMQALHNRYGKPVIFTEIGYQSRNGTSATPWGNASGEVAQEPQQRAYEAAYRVWSGVPWFKGLYWWDWSAGKDNDSVGDGSYRPAGKLAEATIASWSTAPATRPAPPLCQASAPRALQEPKVTLKAKLHRSGGERRVAIFSGRVKRGQTPCRGPVLVRVKRLERRRAAKRGKAGRRHWILRFKLRSRTAADGSFKFAPRRVRAGRYRARSSVRGSSCGGPARSAPIRFKVR